MSATKLPKGCPEIGLTIRVGRPEGGCGLGHFDPAKREIVVSPNQPRAGMHVVLLHELLHAVDEAMVGAGVTRRRTSHRWIESAALNLLLALVTAGLYRGVDKAELLAFYAGRGRRKRRIAGGGR